MCRTTTDQPKIVPTVSMMACPNSTLTLFVGDPNPNAFAQATTPCGPPANLTSTTGPT